MPENLYTEIYTMYIIQLTVTLLVASLNILMGLFIFLKNPRSWTNTLFAVIALIVASWAVSNFFSLNAQDNPGVTLFWIRVVMTITAWLGPVIFLFVKSYPHPSISLSRKWIYAILGLGGVTSMIAPTPLLFSGVAISNGNITPMPGPAIPLFAFGFVGLTFAALILLVIKFFKTHGVERVQLAFLLVGMVLTFAFTVFATFIVVIFFKSSALVFLGPSSSIFLIAFVTYAIVKHRFLDLKIVIFRAVSFFILLTFLALVYVGLFITLGSYIFGITLTPLTTVFFVLISFGVGITLPFVRMVIEKITAPVFYHDLYNEGELIKAITNILSRTIVLEKLVTDVFREIFMRMKVSSCYIELYDDSGSKVWSRGFRYPEGKTDPYLLHKVTNDLIKKSDENIFMFDELEDEKMKDVFRDLNCSVLLPLIVKRELAGILILGEKASGEVYSSRDIEMFKIIAPELAIGIKNAFAYEQIQEFNVTLKDEVKKATTELRAANKRLLELDARKDEFISIASHELRTPMTAIKGYLWMSLYQSPDALPPVIKKNLEICYHSAERLIHLVNDMLTVSRIESNRIDLNLQAVDLVQILQSIYDELAIQATERKIAFSFDKNPGVIMMEADKDKIREVFQNIIGNALKFVPSDIGNVKVNATMPDDSHVKVEIIDNGPGIRQEDMDKLYTKFGKLDHAYNKTQTMQGTGLGLYICKKIVDLHSGEITVQSTVNKGTTFTILLPLHAGRR